jgi:4-hydroxy-tetrahydrodipicolinate synthase
VSAKIPSGVYAAAVTPLKPNGGIDLDAVAPFLSFLSGRGCHGALLLGTTGEGPSFSPAERVALWQAATAVRQEHQDFGLLAGTGTPSLTETIELTRQAFDLGFDGVVTLPPYYFRSAPAEGLYEWFRQVISEAVPDGGLLFGYHFPGVAGIGFTPDLLGRLKETFPRKFAGIKDSSHDREFALQVASRFGGDLLVFNGTDSDLSWALDQEAAGCITAAANLISPGLRQVYDAHARGKGADSAQQLVTRQRHALEHYMPFPPTVKALLHRIHELPAWPVRPPLVDLSEATAAAALEEFSRQQ